MRPRRQPRWPSIGLASCSRSTWCRSLRLPSISSSVLSMSRMLAARCKESFSSDSSPSSSSMFGRNSWSGGSSRRMVTGRPSIALKMPTKSRRWSGSNLSSAFSRAHAKPPELVGPRHQLAEVVAERRLNRRHSSEEDSSGRAVNGDPLALGDDNAVDVELLLAVINVQNARAAHAGLAHAARDYSRMARHPPARRHNRLRRDHAVEVVGACLLPDEHDLLALARHLLGLVRIEDDFALRRAGAGGQAFRDDLRVGVRVNGRVQKLVKLFGRDAAHGCRLVNQTFVHHVHGDLDGGRARALARARLEHEEASALDCELHVLHVVVVALQQLDDVSELLVDGGQFFLQLADGLRRADACDHVLALRVQEILAIELLLPR